jgi:hypothetical protein
MRLENPKALKTSASEKLLPQPKDGQAFIVIPTKNLLGYRGTEEFYKAVVATKPQTFDGNPVKPLSELDMRPRVSQLPPEDKLTFEAFPVLQSTRRNVIDSTEKKAS